MKAGHLGQEAAQNWDICIQDSWRDVSSAAEIIGRETVDARVAVAVTFRYQPAVG
jgi:hypothetical protein